MKNIILPSVENLFCKLSGVINISAPQSIILLINRTKRSLIRLALLMTLLLSGAGVMATNYYTYTNGNPSVLNNWWTGTNGSGTHPTSFTNTGDVFIIQNNNTMTISPNWVVSNLTINAGSALNITGSGALSLEGNFTNHGSLSGTGSTYIFFSGNANQNIDGFTTNGVVSMAKDGGTATFNGNVNGGSLYISGTGGTLNLGAGLTHTFTGSWTRTAGTLEGGSSLLRIEGSVISTLGTFIPGTGTVEWNGYYDQTIAAVTYNNLILSGSEIKSIASGTSVSGNLSIAPTGTATASVAGGVTINTGTLTLGGTGTTSGTWGNTASSASHTNNTYFAASTGMVNVATSSCPSFTCTISGTNSICSGSSTNLKVTISGGTSPYTLVYSGGTVSNYTSGSNIPVSPTSTTTYTLTSVTDATGCVHTGSNADGTATITVNEAPNITSQPTSPSAVCAGANSSTFRVAASGGGLTYQWQRGISGVYENITGSTIPTDGAVYSGYTTAELTVANATIAMNGYTYRCVVTGTCPPLGTSDGLATLTINPLPVVSCPQSFTVYLTNQLIPLTGGLPAGGLYSGTGVNSGSFSPTVAGLGAHTITYSYTDGNSCTSSCTFTITVNPIPADYCNGSAYAVIEENNAFPDYPLNSNNALGPINGTVASLESHEYLILDLTGGRVLPLGSTITVRWHKTDMYNLADPVAHVDISTNVSSWTPMNDYTLTSSTTNFEQSLTLNADTRYIKLTNKNWSSALVSIDGFTYSCESCSAPLISEHPSTSPQILCINGSATALSVTATGTGLTYQWYSNTTASNSGGSAIEDATASSYTPLTTSTGILYYYCVVSNACPPSATSNVSGAVTVDPVSVGGTIAGSATVCPGTNSTVLTLSGNTGTVSKWQYKTSSDWTDVDNTTLTLTATDLTATTEYRAVVTSGVCSSANSATATVTVDPVSVGGTIAGSATVCPGTNSTVLTLSGNTGTVSKWQYKTSGDWTDVDNTTLTLTATDLTTTTEYRAVVTSGVCSSANSATVTVTVESTPVAGALTKTPDMATVCEGTQVSATLTAGSGGNSNDEFDYSTNSGTSWAPYSSGTPIPTSGKTSIEIRTRRMADVCDPSAHNTVSWIVVADPAAPTATKSPADVSVCAGQMLTLTGVTDNGGGTGTCNIEYSHNGAAWTTTLTPFPATVGTNTIAIRKNCNGSSCDLSPVSTYSWSVNTAPTFTACPVNITQNTDANVCTAVLDYIATASGTPAPTVTYAFTGSNPPSPARGSGTGSGATFNKGVTTVTITASNGCTPDATCSFTVTVADDKAPVIADAANITKTADPGKCYAIVAVTPPAVADNCDQNIIPISNFELITNGNFNSGDARWEEASNTAEVETEEFYIVPLPNPSSNHVAEIDKFVSLGQNISGFIVGEEYILTFKASRRQNSNTPNPAEAVVTIDGGALSQVVQRTNLIFNLTTTFYTFTATQPTHKLTFTTNNIRGTLGIIIDDISITKMRYPFGITTITWTATDEAGNAAVAKTQTVTVNDNEKPVVNVPTPEASYPTDLHACKATLTLAAAPTDNCGVLSTVYSVAGIPITFPYDFPVGSTTVDVLVTDIHTNTNTGSFTVKVTDNESPTITAQAVTANSNDDGTGNCTTTVALGTPETGDNCGVNSTFAIVGNEMINPATYLFPVGQTTVTWDVVDNSGNRNSCTQLVTVIDNENPTASSPATVNVECFSDIPDPNVEVVTDEADNCGTPVVTFVNDDITSAVCDGDVVKVTRKYKVTDGSTNFIYVYQTINVDDVTPPTVLTKPVTVTLDMNGNASITVDAVNNGTTDNCDGNLDYSLSQSTFTCADVPSKTVTLSATDCAKNTGTNTAVVTVNQRATKLVINTLILAGEYSDPVSLKATLTDLATGTKLSGKTVKFQIGTQSETGTTDANGIATLSITLSQAPGAYTLTASYTGACPYLASSATNPFLILQERACATYTGVLTASTGSVNSTKATLLLSATVVAASDGNSGDIRNALVSFLADGVLIKQLPVGLVTQGNTAVGSAATEYTYELGTQQGATVTISVWISGYYRNMLSSDCFDITEVTISKPGTDFITGGGYLLLETGKHAGTIKADDNSKNNFGFNVKYNKKATNLQGNINTIVRKTQSDYNADLNVYENVVHKIQIKGTALTSLAISNAINAEFTGKAVAQDITDPTNVVSLGGNLVMKVVMTDNGEPGSKDLLSMTVFDKMGGVLFSSRWENNKPVKQLLAAGNLQVNPSGLKSVEITTADTPVYTDEPTLKVYPNPFSDRLYFDFVSPVNVNARIDIFDNNGRLVQTLFDKQIEAGIINKIEFTPLKLISGIYIYRLIMGEEVFNGNIIYKE